MKKTYDMIEKLFTSRIWPYAAILVSIFMLASAHAFENFGKMFPCELCLKQREPYWAAIFLAISGLVLFRAKPNWPILKGTNLLLGLVFLYGTGYALYHSGVEWGLFEAGCQSVDLDPTQSLSLDAPIVVGKCDEPPLVIFGITMANMNAFAAMLLAMASFMSAFRKNQN